MSWKDLPPKARPRRTINTYFSVQQNSGLLVNSVKIVVPSILPQAKSNDTLVEWCGGADFKAEIQPQVYKYLFWESQRVTAEADVGNNNRKGPDAS